MSAECDVIKALALAGDVTAAQSLTPAARKELKQSACSHSTCMEITSHGEPYRLRCLVCGLEMDRDEREGA